MIRIELDVMLARRKMTLTELSRRLDIALPNLSILKKVTRRQFAWRCSMRSAANWTVSRANCWCGNRTTRQKRNNHP